MFYQVLPLSQTLCKCWQQVEFVQRLQIELFMCIPIVFNTIVIFAVQFLNIYIDFIFFAANEKSKPKKYKSCIFDSQ